MPISSEKNFEKKLFLFKEWLKEKERYSGENIQIEPHASSEASGFSNETFSCRVIGKNLVEDIVLRIKPTGFQVFPKSEGSICLDDKKKIQIDPNYLSDNYDKALAYQAFKSAINLLKKAGFSRRGKDLLLDDIEQNIEVETYSGYHLIGTNRMAKDKDRGVVDLNFKVFGINNLYVCDASIFPDFVSTHQYLPTLAASKIFSLKQGLLS